MLQIDHIYEFFNTHLFNNFTVYTLPNGVPNKKHNVNLFNFDPEQKNQIFFYDQEPILSGFSEPYFYNYANPKLNQVLVTSEKSKLVDDICEKYNFTPMYYFFHGFAALDWYRGFKILNYNKPIVNYNNDYITFNRLTQDDRSYRILFLALLKEQGLLPYGDISFNPIEDENWRKEFENPYTKLTVDQIEFIKEQDLPLSIRFDSDNVPGHASADIPRTINAFWHIVTESVFYYDKLHLTEKIFKPIVMKQPFMLAAAPGNLEYLRSYGFKTFGNVIDESYDNITDPEARLRAITANILHFKQLSTAEKGNIAHEVERTVEHNFKWFFGGFRDKIVDEMLDNVQNLHEKLDTDKDLEIEKLRLILKS